MEGKSTYQLTGLSYIVKKGHSLLILKRIWMNHHLKKIVNYIEMDIRDYLSLPETKGQKIQNDNYTTQFLLRNEKTFLTISN